MKVGYMSSSFFRVKNFQEKIGKARNAQSVTKAKQKSKIPSDSSKLVTAKL